MFKKYFASLVCFILTLTLFTGCICDNDIEQTSTTKHYSQEEISRYIPIKMGFVYSGFIGDKGWSSAHNEARKTLEYELKLNTSYVENVMTNEDAVKAIQKLIDDDCNVISTCSLSFLDATVEAAKNNPEIYFFNCAGNVTLDNLSTFFGKKYQATYLCGIVAGMRTQTNKIGYVAANKVPEVIRGINAFTLGVQSVNPNAEIYVRWTNYWYNPPVEKSNAIELINLNCDVITQHQNTTGCQIAAQQAQNSGKDVWCIGEHIPNLQEAPDAYLTAPLFEYFEYYKSQLDQIVDGTWKPTAYWAGLDENIVSIDTLSPNCAEGTQEKVDKAYNEILAGTEKIFEGPIYDNNGNLRIKEGECMTDEELLNFDWFVYGVIE